MRSPDNGLRPRQRLLGSSVRKVLSGCPRKSIHCNLIIALPATATLWTSRLTATSLTHWFAHCSIVVDFTPPAGICQDGPAKFL